MRLQSEGLFEVCHHGVAIVDYIVYVVYIFEQDDLLLSVGTAWLMVLRRPGPCTAAVSRSGISRCGTEAPNPSGVRYAGQTRATTSIDFDIRLLDDLAH